MKITKLAGDIRSWDLRGEDLDISGLSCDSRKVSHGDLFFCLPGMRFDGHAFANDAIESGAAALVVERFIDVKVPQLKVSDVRGAMAYMAQAFYDYPAKTMKAIGITGTKGKTTSSFLVKAILDAAGYKSGLIGTVGTRIGDKKEPSTLTTPDPIDLQGLLARMRDAGCSAFTMEVSAHAIDLRKIEGIAFDVGIFTNFSQDHLDYFGDMQTYFNAKKRFFTPEHVRHAVINIDDPALTQVGEDMQRTTFAVAMPSDVFATDIEIFENGLSYRLHYKGEECTLKLQLSGLFNVYNSMAAASACLCIGVPMEAVQRGLEAVSVVPGRIEQLKTATPYSVILDYAHSPASLENILNAVREFTKGRLICLFGCGGGRDQEKRPLMGAIAGRLADYSILTSDNPRYEKPMDIIRQIEGGITLTDASYSIIENRREAIRYALNMAKAGDTVILAG